MSLAPMGIEECRREAVPESESEVWVSVLPVDFYVTLSPA